MPKKIVFEGEQWFSDNLKSERFSWFNIRGHRVEVRQHKIGKDVIFNAYVKLKDSNVLSDTFLGHPTYREGDVLGVDTAHARNEGQSEVRRLADALHQIESIIESWKNATEEGYYE